MKSKTGKLKKKRGGKGKGKSGEEAGLKHTNLKKGEPAAEERDLGRVWKNECNAWLTFVTMLVTARVALAANCPVAVLGAH